METQAAGSEVVEKLKSRTPLRLKYEAEALVIQKEIGSLEEVRARLGLSQRKIAQILMVDPSAWTRWSKEGRAPAHIFRMLEWYLRIRDLAPHSSHQFYEGKTLDIKNSAITSELNRLQASHNSLLSKVEALNRENFSLQRRLGLVLKALTALVFLTPFLVFLMRLALK